MRPLWKDILAAVWLGIIIPGIVLHGLMIVRRPVIASQRDNHVAVELVQQKQIVMKRRDGLLLTVEADRYLTGVLLAEMPASFEEEALKAQAVAARTYVYKAEVTGGKHGDGSVCTESVCCQAYLDEETYLSKGGTLEGLEKVRHAVEVTSPYVLTYCGELIEAVYFSSSGGVTESALAVWGTDFPYLQSVMSPGEEDSAFHKDTVRISEDRFRMLLGRELPDACNTWFGKVTYTEGKGVEQIEICGENYSGTELRALLNLPSTFFAINTTEDGLIIIETRGYGHRVGLSQYGANAMALEGSSYRQILEHYYPGTELTAME